MRLIRKPSLPSPAMVVALVALFVALGGSAYALTITGADIRNRSVPGTKMQLNSVGGNAVKESALTRRSLVGRQLKLDSVGGNAVKESSLGPVSQAAGATHHAVVNAEGGFVRGRGVAPAGVSRTATGSYVVVFDRTVGSCAYSALLADPAAGDPPSGQIGAATSGENPSGVQVRTRDADGQDADLPFHLVLSC